MTKTNLIDYWSPSSMALFLNNPMAFKKKYILKQYDDISSPTSVVGNAGHKALEVFYQGMSQDEAIAVGLKNITEKSDMGINYGKTGSREKMLQNYTQAINFYFQELQPPHEVLGVEESITVEALNLQGEPLSLPIKIKADLVGRNKLGELEVTDHKFVGSYTDPDVDDFKKWLQGMFNYYAVKAKYGEAPARIIYNECKVSLNSGANKGMPQLQPYNYEFNSTADFATFEKLFNLCTTQLNLPGFQFLPNPNDIFDGQITFELFRSGTMDVARPVAVPHKTEQVKFADKNYIPSAFDRVENQNFTPEAKIAAKLQEFAIPVETAETHVGPSVTQYTFKPNRGVRMANVARLDKDLALALEAESLRIEAPIRGKNLIGVEVPNKVRKTIELTDSHLHKGTTDIPIGVNVFGETIYKDLADMPHLLIAGATGAGKSVMINVLITALTRQLGPDKLKLVLIDPKQVELASFDKLPHLLQPVVQDNKGAIEALDKMVIEMERRYAQLKSAGVRSIDEFAGSMPKIVIVVDEFADLMMSAQKGGTDGIDLKQLTRVMNQVAAFKLVSGKKISQKDIKEAMDEASDKNGVTAETSIIRIAQKARAVGIHLVLATQRPSVDVVTGLIKANVPTKICFMTTNRSNSQIILDANGAEELIGKGDMLFVDTGKAGLQRLQGLYK